MTRGSLLSSYSGNCKTKCWFLSWALCQTCRDLRSPRRRHCLKGVRSSSANAHQAAGVTDRVGAKQVLHCLVDLLLVLGVANVSDPKIDMHAPMRRRSGGCRDDLLSLRMASTRSASTASPTSTPYICASTTRRYSSTPSRSSPSAARICGRCRCRCARPMATASTTEISVPPLEPLPPQYCFPKNIGETS